MKKIGSKGAKKGVSPVIATVLLVAIVVVIGAIIFLWFRGMMQEKVTKFGDENIELACDKIGFDASVSGNSVTISNNGNTPIWKMKAQVENDQGFETETISSGWPSNGLNEGGVFSGTVSGLNNAERVIFIPVLLGNDEEGIQVEYSCDEADGVEIEIN